MSGGTTEDGDSSLFTHFGLEWNPQGHPPSGIYEDPRFDFHFYLVPEAERLAFSTGLDRMPVFPRFVPDNYVQGTEAPDWKDY
jgi:hypothetical protein